MTFKQWLKHREQNPQPTQPVPAQPAQWTGKQTDDPHP